MSTACRQGGSPRALAQKVIDRVGAAGVPDDLIPADLITITVNAGGDAENELRTRVLEFMAAVRLAEKAVAAGRGGGELDPMAVGSVSPEWREHWPIEVECDAAGIPRAVVRRQPDSE